MAVAAKPNVLEMAEEGGYHLLLLRLKLLKGGVLSIFVGVSTEKRNALLALPEVTSKDITEANIILSIVGSEVTLTQVESAKKFFLGHFLTAQKMESKAEKKKVVP